MDLSVSFNLTNLDFSGFRPVISEIVGNVVEDVYNDTVREAAYDSGDLKRSIKKHFVAGDLEGSVTVSAKYWYCVEYGTPAHEIVISTKKVLSDGTSIFGKRVFHPGTRAKPFMRPAIFKSRTFRHKYGR